MISITFPLEFKWAFELSTISKTLLPYGKFYTQGLNILLIVYLKISTLYQLTLSPPNIIIRYSLWLLNGFLFPWDDQIRVDVSNSFSNVVVTPRVKFLFFYIPEKTLTCD